MDSFSASDHEKFLEDMNKIAFLALLKKEYQLGSKVYNILGHAYLYWKMPLLAYSSFVKLGDVSRMDGDLETTMYAFQQCGVTLNQNKNH